MERYGFPAAEDPEAVFDLSQSPFKRPTWTTGSGTLPCLTRGSLLWHAAARRVVLPMELSAAMGLPVTALLAEHGRVDRDAGVYTPGQLGNGMHVACVAAAMAVALAACPQ